MFVVTKTTIGKCDYGLGVRVWDALLFVALIQRPRRDFGIVMDFTRNITTYMMQMLPKSILPYNTLPAERIDNFSSEQVVYNIESLSTRPEQLLRFRDNNTIGPFATFAYQSPGPTALAEDDAYMAPIVALAKMLNFPSLYTIPLHLWTLDIGWEYGTVYPMAVYDENNCTNYDLQGHIALVLNQRRCSMMLYAQTPASIDKERELSLQDIREQDFRPYMELLAEFTPTRQNGPKVVHCSTFFDCQKKLFQTGTGPVPFIRRPGAAVLIQSLIGCITPHERGRHGCKSPRKCYYCVDNPYTEVTMGGGIIERLDPRAAVAESFIKVSIR